MGLTPYRIADPLQNSVYVLAVNAYYDFYNMSCGSMSTIH